MTVQHHICGKYCDSHVLSNSVDPDQSSLFKMQGHVAQSVACLLKSKRSLVR